MPVMLERWNDDKMDALKDEVDGLGVQIRELRQEMKAGFERVDDRFERMQRMMFNGMIALTSGFLAGFGGLIALVVALH